MMIDNSNQTITLVIGDRKQLPIIENEKSLPKTVDTELPSDRADQKSRPKIAHKKLLLKTSDR